MELKRDLKPEIVLRDRKVIIEISDIMKTEIGIIELLKAITEATPTERDDELLKVIKPVLKTVLDSIGK